MSRTSPSHAGALEAVFPENNSPAAPLAMNAAERLPSPFSILEIPLTRRVNPPRIVIADDDRSALEAWQRSAASFYENAIDLRTWQPASAAGQPGLVEQVRLWDKEGWRPDVVAIDLNFDDGGKHGVHYVEELRSEPGYAAMPIVMATGNQYSDLEQGKLSHNQGNNKTKESPTAWLRRLKPLEPEAILYGKTGDARFLGRLGQGLPDWKRAARRRAWVKLLGKVATTLDAVSIDVGKVAQEMVDFAFAELCVDHAVVRQRIADGRYRLIAKRTTVSHADIGDELSMDEVPVLREIVDDAHAAREPVLSLSVGHAEAGKYADTIEDMRLLGAAAVLGSRPVGFIALLRTADRDPFDEEVDARYLKILARLLASAIRVSLLRERQTRLLEFANHASKATRRKLVSEHLVDILHDELHHNDDTSAKTTVRLLDFGTGEFQVRADKGVASESRGALARGKEGHAAYADVVRSNQPVRAARQAPELPSPELTDSMQSTLRVPLSVGGFALGVVNLEHRHGDYYRENDQSFACAAAALAASALERIRVERLLGDMAEFVLSFAREDTMVLDVRLRNLLYLFCGYSALVDLEADTCVDAPWRIKHLDVRSGTGDTNALKAEMGEIYATEWPATLMGRLVATKQWQDGWAMFTSNPSEFRSITLATDFPVTQTADAVLWIRNGEAPPHRALLLMWSFPPPLGESDVSLLGTMAKVFSELHSRKATVEELVRKNLVGEQAAQIGHVLQHFKHRLGNLTGGHTGHLDGLEEAFLIGDAAKFREALERARGNTRDLANAFHKSRGYVKPVELEDVPLRALVEAATEDLGARLRNVKVDNDIHDRLAVCTDTKIASLIIYSLLENALDAVDEQALPGIQLSAETLGDWVRLRISDNGYGVSETVRMHLFEWGTTTKSAGLGSALAFARARAQTLGGELEFVHTGSSRGATFELRLPPAGSKRGES